MNRKERETKEICLLPLTAATGKKEKKIKWVATIPLNPKEDLNNLHSVATVFDSEKQSADTFCLHRLFMGNGLI